MTRLLRAVLLAILCNCLLALPAAPAAEQQEDSATGYRLTAVQWTGDTLRLEGDRQPAYTVYELIDPLRLVIDIAAGSVAPSADLPRRWAQGPVAQITARTINDRQPAITRLEIFLAADRGYTVEADGTDLLVHFAPATADQETANGQARPQDQQVPSRINSIEVSQTDTETTVLIKADAPITSYNYEELTATASSPARLYVDIAGVTANTLPSSQQVGSALAGIRSAQRGDGVRIVFDAAGPKLFNYQLDSVEEGLQVTITEQQHGAAALIASLMQDETPAATAPLATTTAEQTATDNDSEPEGLEDTPPATDTFGFSGYNQQRITVDFYKIDLHNVFRLIGDISGKNIVVDEAVSGSLTLSLEDVPWDFALDVIMNLKDLQKEERFNTIVISPKSKGFIWPEKASDNIAFKADPITIKKRRDAPKEVIGAKQIVSQAREMERKGDYDAALALYEKAHRQWPEHGETARRMAAIYLVHKKINAQAAYYAQEALRSDATDQQAALLAAIANANMGREGEAKEFFDLAVAGARPEADALRSYAAFLEQGGNYTAALTMLDRHTALYGDSLETLITKARLYDKNQQETRAVAEYRAALLSGYTIPKDLEKYIKARLVMADQ